MASLHDGIAKLGEGNPVYTAYQHRLEEVNSTLAQLQASETTLYLPVLIQSNEKEVTVTYAGGEMGSVVRDAVMKVVQKATGTQPHVAVSDFTQIIRGGRCTGDLSTLLAAELRKEQYQLLADCGVQVKIFETVQRPNDVLAEQYAVTVVETPGSGDGQRMPAVAEPDRKPAKMVPREIDVRKYNTLEKIRTGDFPGIPAFDKDDIRWGMLEKIIEILPEPECVNYLGLEGPRFGSYIALSELLHINAKNSLVAEHDHDTYRMMEELVRHADSIEGGQIFKGLRLHEGKVARALTEHSGLRFDVANLDYMGSLSKEKYDSWHKLFVGRMFANEAVMFITVSNHERDRERIKSGANYLPKEHGYGTDDQEQVIHGLLTDLATRNDYKLRKLGSEEYMSRQTPMLFMAYKVERLHRV